MGKPRNDDFIPEPETEVPAGTTVEEEPEAEVSIVRTVVRAGCSWEVELEPGATLVVKGAIPE